MLHNWEELKSFRMLITDSVRGFHTTILAGYVSRQNWRDWNVFVLYSNVVCCSVIFTDGIEFLYKTNIKYANMLTTEARFLPDTPTQSRLPDYRFPPKSDLSTGATVASHALHSALIQLFAVMLEVDSVLSNEYVRYNLKYNVVHIHEWHYISDIINEINVIRYIFI
jgi:hypothetical protein